MGRIEKPGFSNETSRPLSHRAVSRSFYAKKKPKSVMELAQTPFAE
jgi:hypothetical protein